MFFNQIFVNKTRHYRSLSLFMFCLFKIFNILLHNLDMMDKIFYVLLHDLDVLRHDLDMMDNDQTQPLNLRSHGI